MIGKMNRWCLAIELVRDPQKLCGSSDKTPLITLIFYSFHRNEKFIMVLDTHIHKFHDIHKLFHSYHDCVYCSQPMKVPACQHLKDEVLNCYKQNPRHALNCSQQVQDFLHCVEVLQTVHFVFLPLLLLLKKSLVKS